MELNKFKKTKKKGGAKKMKSTKLKKLLAVFLPVMLFASLILIPGLASALTTNVAYTGNGGRISSYSHDWSEWIDYGEEWEWEWNGRVANVINGYIAYNTPWAPWVINYPTGTECVTIKFDKAYSVDRINHWNDGEWGADAVTIKTSNDGVNFTPLTPLSTFSNLNVSAGTPNLNTFTFSPVTCQYMKFEYTQFHDSAWFQIAELEVFTAEGPDTQKPTAPTNLVATAASHIKVNLYWEASRDNIGVTGYKIERSLNGTTGWTKIDTSATTSYSDTSASPSTKYFYRVSAYDAANNMSAPSNVADATTLAPPIPVTTATVSPLQPDAVQGWWRTQPVITLTSSEFGTIYYQWDSTSGAWLTYGAVPQDTPIKAPEDSNGAHTLYFYSVSSYGGREKVKCLKFKYDHTKPPVILTEHGTCEGCHHEQSDSIVGTPHDTELTAAPAKCDRCHNMAGSTLPYLLRSSIMDNSGVSHTVTGLNNTVCYACHTATSGAYPGKSLYEKTKHYTISASGLALSRLTDLSYGPGMCGNCHNSHGVEGITKYRRLAGNDLCSYCHDDAALPSKLATYSYQGLASYGITLHGSTTNSYNKWPNPGETGNAASGECVNCHNVHGKNDGTGNPIAKLALAIGENLCYGGSGSSGACHAAATGSQNGDINIYSRFNASTDNTAKHSLGAGLKCTNCHNTHLNNRSRKLIDPDSIGTLYLGSEINFCNKCHDNSPPVGVSVPPYANISTTYATDFHGGRVGDGIVHIDEGSGSYGDPNANGTILQGNLKGSYTRGMTALNCTTCHDTHGSANVYHLKETVNSSPVTSVSSLCSACHNNTPDYIHQKCNDCHSALGQYHGGEFNERSCDFTYDFDNSQCLNCHGHGKIREVGCHRGRIHKFGSTF